jgi:[ribosomal protein S18]-alanine N-acetyltransferase
MTVSIRKAGLDDVTAIADLDISLYGMNGYGHYTIRQFQDLFPDSFFVGEEAGAVIGYAVIGVGAGTRTGWLLSISVELAWQGKGVGRALMQSGLAYCEKAGLEVCRLTVDPDNIPAIHLYRSLGFDVAKQVQGYFQTGDARLIMFKRWQPALG